MNEDAKVGLAPGVNGKSGPWSFEELIDLNVHGKGRPLMEAEACNQGLIACETGAPEGPRVAFEEKTPVSSLHPSQPIEALSGKGSNHRITARSVYVMKKIVTSKAQSVLSDMALVCSQDYLSRK